MAEARAGLAARADPDRAPGMRAYMKSAMPYHGVMTAGVRDVCRTAFAAYPLVTFEEWRETALELWRRATYREERYVALELVGAPRYRNFRTVAALPMYEEMITTGAWWDLVDPIATSRLGELLVTEPAVVAPLLRDWARDENLWKRRSAIIAQVKLRARTDLDLLSACIEANLHDRDFFIRKAIGWSLRAHAWTDPGWVRAYAAANGSRLSGLSRREALKNL